MAMAVAAATTAPSAAPTRCDCRLRHPALGGLGAAFLNSSPALTPAKWRFAFHPTHPLCRRPCTRDGSSDPDTRGRRVGAVYRPVTRTSCWPGAAGFGILQLAFTLERAVARTRIRSPSWWALHAFAEADTSSVTEPSLYLPSVMNTSRAITSSRQRDANPHANSKREAILISSATRDGIIRSLFARRAPRRCEERSIA